MAEPENRAEPRVGARTGALIVRAVDPRTLSEAALERCLAVLCAEERARAERFRFERHRREFCAAHALLRHTLSRCAPVAPEDWRFEREPRGRPRLAHASRARAPDLRFNLSHTQGLVACAVTRGRDVGCDVEHCGREIDTLALARRYFSASETRDLEARRGAARRERFFLYWTLKEAYLKARGAGLQLPLAAVRFELDCAVGARAHFAAELADDPARWQFTLLRPTREHALALALEAGRAERATFEVEHGLPECEDP